MGEVRALIRSFAEILDWRSFDTEQRIVNVSFLELRRIKIEFSAFFIFLSSSGLNSFISSDSASSITNLKLSISWVLEDLIVAVLKVLPPFLRPLFSVKSLLTFSSISSVGAFNSFGVEETDF